MLRYLITFVFGYGYIVTTLLRGIGKYIDFYLIDDMYDTTFL